MDTIAAWFACWFLIVALALSLGWITGRVPEDRSSLDGWGMD